MNFSEAMFYENHFTSDFHTNTVISRRVCLLVKMASKTVIRPIINHYQETIIVSCHYITVTNAQISQMCTSKETTIINQQDLAIFTIYLLVYDLLG